MSCTETLRDQGYRLTPQRKLIFSTIHHSTGHISADEIYSQVCAKYPRVNISTIYRTLELLKELGLVMEIDLSEGRLRYHDVDKGHHHHLICQKCGRISELDESLLLPLKNLVFDKYSFRADLNHLAIFGKCGQCGG
ncbi:Fur family transcriptional regulator [Chloroflexota bacterium]